MAKTTIKGSKPKEGAVFKDGYLSGNDAAYIKPRLIPDYELLARDDSGGPEWDPYAMQFGDGGYVTGDKAHLSARGSEDDKMANDEEDQYYRAGSAKAVKEGNKTPASSKKYSKSENE